MPHRKLRMKRFFKNLRFLSGSSILFSIITVSLLALSMVQVNCPICSIVAIRSPGNSLGSVKVLEVKEEFIDYRLEHEWCFGLLLILNYEVDISLVNEGSESLSIPLLIKSTITVPQAELAEEQLMGSTMLWYVEVPGKDTKQVQEIVSVELFGVPGAARIPDIEFSVTTDPDKIIASCPVCRGKGKIPFTDWPKAVVQ